MASGYHLIEAIADRVPEPLLKMWDDHAQKVNKSLAAHHYGPRRDGRTLRNATVRAVAHDRLVVQKSQ